MKTVKEISRLTGISVRTLHYYDEINLLKPTQITDAGYRLYDDTALERLHSILLFRELEFSLKEIKTILDSPELDTQVALQEQIKLLELKKSRLDKIINSARKLLLKGNKNMSFSEFDKTEIDKYADEAKQKWGHTEAYKEFEEMHSNSFDKTDEFMHIFAEIGKIKHLAPNSQEAQNLIKELQNFITENYYNCTNDILKGLGQMYTADERFKNSIDKAGGTGTAEFTAKIIESMNQ
ncbi:MAG: MerR family transcriptional regulator [Eubacterium sp.]|nr:MerR family transcriptional regulator [Eubacterium sp.]MDE6155351.1 MerR family transcriptional regulator [Eubacterium sp.]